MTNAAKNYQSDAIARKDRVSQELFGNTLNEIRSVNTNYNNQCIVEFIMHTNVAGKKINVAINEDLKRLESLASNVITPYASPLFQKNTFYLRGFIEGTLEI